MTYKKPRHPSFGQRADEGQRSESKELRDLVVGSPASSRFIPPKGDKPADLVRYLIATQTAAHGHNALEKFSYETLLRNMKLLLKKFPAEDIKREIALAPHLCRYPVSTKWLRTRLEGDKE